MFKKIFITLVAWMLPVIAMAAESGAADAAAGSSPSVKIGFGLAAAFAIGVAAFGGALGQGKTAAAALEGIARNPEAQGKIFIPMLIALALIESLVIYALVVAFSLIGKI